MGKKKEEKENVLPGYDRSSKMIGVCATIYGDGVLQFPVGTGYRFLKIMKERMVEVFNRETGEVIAHIKFDSLRTISTSNWMSNRSEVEK